MLKVRYRHDQEKARKIKRLKGYARANKRKRNKGEDAFRSLLMKYRIHYQRQKVIGKFIVDFYLPKRKLIVEIDGDYHRHNQEYDEYRQKWLQKQGFFLLRFTDLQVETQPEFCIEQILHEAETKAKYRWCKQKLASINASKKYKSEDDRLKAQMNKRIRRIKDKGWVVY